MRVNAFIPCVVDQMFPKTAESMINILEHYKVSIDYNAEQTCCGQMAYKNGYIEQAISLGDKFISEMNNGNYVVSPSVSCIVMLRKYYPKLFYNTSRHNELKQLLPKCYEFTDFMYNVLGIKKVHCSHNATITIHSSCSVNDYDEPNTTHKLLSTISGVNIVNLPNADVCCGFGGTFSYKNPYISAAMAEEKLQDAIKTGAQYLISNEPSCLLHLQSYARKQNIPLQILHVADFIAMALDLQSS